MYSKTSVKWTCKKCCALIKWYSKCIYLFLLFGNNMLLRWVYLLVFGSGDISSIFNSLRPRLNRRPFADDIFKCIYENKNEWILPKISLKFVPKVRINIIPALVQIMAWRRPGDKPLSEPMMFSLVTHICVTRPQWVKTVLPSDALWRWRSESTLAQVMACRQTAPRHYLSECLLIINGVLSHTHGRSFTMTTD